MRKTGQPTINDVARVAGVSKKTVSRVMNRSPLLSADTRRRVEEVIDELGYVPNLQARALALRRNFLIALVHDNPNAQTVLNVQHGVLEALHGTEFAMVVRPLDRASTTMADELRHFLERQRPFGVILLPPISENDAIAKLCADHGCRYVRMGSAELDEPDQLVASNDREAVFEAAQYLISIGHRRIGFIAGPHGFRSARERREGFESALAEANIPFPRGLSADGTYRFESGVAAAERLLDVIPRPTAIFACNDEMAAGVIHIARQRGLDVPRDLSVIGFDDNPIASHIWPPLTTVRWPSMTMARTAALKLIAPEAAGERQAEPSRFRSVLIRRESVAPPSS